MSIQYDFYKRGTFSRMKKHWLVLCAFVAVQPLLGCSPESFGLRFSEPRVEGMVIDKASRKPLQGVLLTGDYILETGTVTGGGGPVTYIHKFSVETDANGRFTIPGWGSSNWLARGFAESKFPELGIYKPGYARKGGNYKSIRYWSPNDQAYSLDNAPTKDGYTLDWTQYPVELVRLTDEFEIIQSLQPGYRDVLPNDCSWEGRAQQLRDEHEELKAWFRRNFAPGDRTPEGYLSDETKVVGRFARATVPTASSRDNILAAHYKFKRLDENIWKCADPEKIFGVEYQPPTPVIRKETAVLKEQPQLGYSVGTPGRAGPDVRSDTSSSNGATRNDKPKGNREW